MNGQLMQIAYTSNSAREFSEARLAEMLSDFRRNNERDNITGLLIYYRQSFLQVFEGPKERVEQLWRHIRNDERHVLVTRIYHRAIDCRVFGEWSMAFENLDNDVDLYLDGFTRLLSENSVNKSTPQNDIETLIKNFTCKV
jgi:hypothetical protein